MKKIIGTLLILFICSMIGYSQFTKGKILAGGSFNLSFNSNKYKSGSITSNTGNTNSFNLYPQVGYFFIDNLAAGAGLNILTGATKYTNAKSTYSSISIAPFVRYYYNKFYGQFSFSSGSLKTTNDIPPAPSNTKSNTTGWSLAGGYAYLLNEHVAIEPQIGYGQSYQTGGGNSGKTTSGGLFIKAGFQIYLGK